MSERESRPWQLRGELVALLVRVRGERSDAELEELVSAVVTSGAAAGTRARGLTVSPAPPADRSP